MVPRLRAVVVFRVGVKMPLPVLEQRRFTERLERALAGYDDNTRLMLLLAALYGQGIIRMKLTIESLVMTAAKVCEMHAGVIDGETLRRIRGLSK
jgi:hypothetical protein